MNNTSLSLANAYNNKEGGQLQFSPININEDYRKKWNVNSHTTDFICLTKNGELINNNIYRLGGLNHPNLKTDRYFILLKCVEAYYSDEVIKDQTQKAHLSEKWCILDSDGNEKVECESFRYPYLVKDSCIYSIASKYYNIESGEFYCHSTTTMKCEEFIFLDNQFDKDTSRRGVMKITKKTGLWELFR